MDADAEKLLMAFMEGTLNEQGAARLLEQLDADPEFLDAAVRHWRMDRLLEEGMGGADGAVEALRRSVRIRLEGSAAESAELSQQVGSRLRARKGSGGSRRLSGRRRSPSTLQPLAWVLGGSLAATVLTAIVFSLSSSGGPAALPISPSTPKRTAVAPSVNPEINVPRAVGESTPVPAPPARASVPVPSDEWRSTTPAPKPALPQKTSPRPVSPKNITPPRRTVPIAPVRIAVLDIAEGSVFVVASVLSRGLRFFLVAGLIYLYGESIRSFIDRYFNLVVSVFVLIFILGFVLISFVL